MTRDSYPLRAFRGFGFTAPGLLWTAVFFLAPLAVMAALSLRRRVGGRTIEGWSFANYAQFLDDGPFREAMLNSLEVTCVVTLLSLLLAYPLAWILAEMVPERWQRLALVLAVLPFWTSYVVRSYSWLLVLAGNGVVNRLLQSAGAIDEPLRLANTRAATIIGFVHFFVMLLTLTIYSSLRQLPRNYRRAAADLGAGPLRVFIHIILPLTLPGVMVGAFLTFVLCIGDYITPQILGGNQELLMPQLIMLQVGRSGDFPTASALAMVLMAVVSIAYLATARWVKLERA